MIRTRESKATEMSWNYKVMKRRFEGYDEVSYVIHSVYYDKEGSVKAWSREPAHPSGSTHDELRSDLLRMVRALSEPVLDPETGAEIEHVKTLFEQLRYRDDKTT